MDVDPRLFENVQVSDSEVRKIVLSYFFHNCSKETAETFIPCSGMKRRADCSVNMGKRKRAFPCYSKSAKRKAGPIVFAAPPSPHCSIAGRRCFDPNPLGSHLKFDLLTRGAHYRFGAMPLFDH